MSDVLTILAVNTAIAAAIAALAVVLWRMTGHAPIVRALLVVALLKLVLPPVFHLNLLPADLAGAETAVVATEREASPPVETIGETTAATIASEPTELGLTPRAARPAASTIRAGEPDRAVSNLSWVGIVFVLWILGSLATLTIVVRRILRCRQLLARATPAPESVRRLATDLSQALGLRRVPDVVVIEVELSPFVFGFMRRPIVVVPQRIVAVLSAAELRAVLAHELSHIANRDHLTRWLELAVLVVHFWNPLLFWIRHRLHDAEEIRCDARAVRVTATSPRGYGRAILKTTIALDAQPAAVPLGVSALGGAHTLKRRLLMIRNERLHHRMSWSGRLVLALGTVALLPIGLNAQDPDTKSKRKKLEAKKVDTGDMSEIRKMVREAVREALKAENVDVAVEHDDFGRVDADEIRAKVQKALEKVHEIDVSGIQEKVQKALKGRGIAVHGDGEVVVIGGDDNKDKAKQALKKRGFAFNGDGDFSVVIDGEDISEKVRAALESVEGFDVDAIHEKVQKALEASGIEGHVVRAGDLGVTIDADEIRRKVKEAMESADVDVEKIRATVRKAMKDGGADVRFGRPRGFEVSIDDGEIRKKLEKGGAKFGKDFKFVWPHRDDDHDDDDEDDEVEDLQRQIESLKKQIRALERRIGRDN